MLPVYFHRPERGPNAFASTRYRAEAFNHGFFRCLPAFGMTDRLGEIRVPTLIVSGRDDWFSPVEWGGERLQAGISESEHIVLERSGHYPFVEEPERFAEVVGHWLARLP